MLIATRNDDGTPLSDRRLRDELVTFLAAGYETTATALGWTLALLAAHPEVAARARQEALSVGADRSALSADHLPTLTYIEQVIREALRLWPPVHTLGRQTREPVVLAGHPLPAGTIVAFSTYLLHRRPDLYPQPDRFLPERFATAGPQPGGRYSYLPFGAGPRACIGGDLALSTLKLLVAGLLARRDLQLPPGADLVPELLVTLRPRGPLPFRFVPRAAPAGRR